MPSNALRPHHLRQHLAWSPHVHPDLAALRRAHPDWGTCHVCRWLIDPAGANPAGDTHLNCEPT